MSSLPPDDDRTVIRPSAAQGGAAHPGPAAPPPPVVPPPPVTSPPPAAPPPPAESEAALPIGTSLGEFQVTSVLGEGGFGIVYLAQDNSLDRRVALKEYMPQALATRAGGTAQVQVRSERHRETFAAGLKSFVNEAKLLAQFDHPSLVKVYRFWEAHGTAYMVMPYYQGVTLKQELKTLAQPPDEIWLMKLLAPLTEALAVIHAENCYHRDIAPDNVILLAGSNRPLLLDFGAARRVIGDMTQALTVILKPGYAPVEQYAEAPEMKQGPWTDVYALAASIYFAILGRTPPPSVGRLMNDNYVPLAVSCAGRYSDGFLRAIDRALSVRPEDRTPSIDALRADLGLPAHRAATDETRMIVESAAGVRRSSAGGSGTVSGSPASAGGSASAAPRPAWRLAASAVGVLAIGGAAAYWALAPHGSAPARPLASAGSATPVAGAASATGTGTLAGPAGTATLAGPTGTATLAGPTGTATLAGPTGTAALAGPTGAATPTTAPTATQTAPVPAAAGRGSVLASGDLPQTPVPGAVPPKSRPSASAGTAGFDILNEFDAAVAAQSPGFELTASAARERLRIGRDRLAFKVRSARAGFVTVLVVDSDGSLVQLIPSREMRNIRIRAGETLGLPPADVSVVAAEPAGTENFLVLVSNAPRDYQPLGMRSEGGYGIFPPAAELASARSRWAVTGVPALLGKPQGCTPTANPTCNDYGAVRFHLEVVR